MKGFKCPRCGLGCSTSIELDDHYIEDSDCMSSALHMVMIHGPQTEYWRLHKLADKECIRKLRERI